MELIEGVFLGSVLVEASSKRLNSQPAAASLCPNDGGGITAALRADH